MNALSDRIFTFCLLWIFILLPQMPEAFAQEPPEPFAKDSDFLWSLNVKGEGIIGRFTPDGANVFFPEMFGARGYPKGKLTFLEATTGKVVSTFSPCRGEEFDIYVYRRQGASFETTGNLMMVSCLSGGIELWNFKHEKLLGIFPARGKEPAISPDGTRLVTSDVTSNDSPELWNTESQARIAILQSNRNGGWHTPLAVSFSADSKMVAISYHTEVRVWDAVHGKPLVSFENNEGVRDGKRGDLSPESRVYDLMFTSDGKTIVTGTGRAIKFWDVDTGKLKYKSSEGHKALLDDLAITPDGSILATATKDKFIKLWDMETGKLILRLPKPEESTQEILFSPNGKNLLYRAWGSQRSILYDVATGRIIWKAKYGAVSHVFSPGWDIVLVKDFKNKVIRAYKMSL